MKFWSQCAELEAQKIPFVVVTLTSVRGSAPQDPGAKMLVTADGLMAGTIGGGKVELAALKQAQQMLSHRTESQPLSVVWNLQKDIGMSCGGEVSLLFEPIFTSSWNIVIFGAGHVAQALTRLLSTLHCSVTCVDSRPEWVDKLQGVKAITHAHPKELVKEFPQDAYFLSITMGHAFDVPILEAIYRHAPQAPYVGVIGSEVKGIKIKKELKDLGVSENFLERLKVPMGLPIGSNHPGEIAISIAAELLQVRDEQVPKPPLKE